MQNICANHDAAVAGQRPSRIVAFSHYLDRQIGFFAAFMRISPDTQRSPNTHFNRKKRNQLRESHRSGYRNAKQQDGAAKRYQQSGG
jgi:hypothetical protein